MIHIPLTAVDGPNIHEIVKTQTTNIIFILSMIEHSINKTHNETAIIQIKLQTL